MAARELGGARARCNGKRERVASALDRVGLLDRVLRYRAVHPMRWLTVLTYHRIADPEREDLVDPEVIDATPAQFEEQLRFLVRHFHLVGTDEVVAYARGGSLPPNPVLITFDDGYRDAAQVAPILRRHRAPAVYFIATAYPSVRRTYWWDAIAYLVRATRREEIVLHYPAPLTVAVDEARNGALREVLRFVKGQPRVDHDWFLSELARATGVCWNRDVDRELSERLIMSWDEIRALAATGMEIESHTRTHRLLKHMKADDATAELRGSRDDLRRELGRAPRSVAYPVGESLVERPDILRAARESGYALGYTNCSGSNDTRRRAHPFDIRRVGMDVRFTPEFFRGMMAIPQLMHPDRIAARRPERLIQSIAAAFL